jgi:hypothetical protein
MRTAIAFRIIPFSLLIALTACQNGIPNVGAPSVSQETAGAGSSATAGLAAHLYVATVTASRRLAIDRYRLHKGIPSASPNRVYQGYSGLIAVSGNGTLYSTLAQSPIVVDVFSPGSDKPVRKINVEPACHFSSSGFNVVNAVAADASGYLFVLLYSYPGAAPSHASRDAGHLPDSRTPCNGIAIYAPSAHGNDRPIQSIRLSNTAGLDGLAVDASDNLYVAGNSVVTEYSNALVDPKITRTFSGKHLGDVRSVATDSAGDVFIANAEQSYSSGWIDRYSPSAKGSGPPTSTIYLQGSGPHLLYSLAVRGRYLYADDTATSVELYYARKNGGQSPLDSLPEPKVDAVAGGP